LQPPVSPASAAGFTVNLSAPSTPVVGKSMILQATGTTPLEDLEFPYWFSLSAIPASALSTCPADHFAAQQVAWNVRPHQFLETGDPYADGGVPPDVILQGTWSSDEHSGGFRDVTYSWHLVPDP
jgi:hypothetical protein